MNCDVPDPSAIMVGGQQYIEDGTCIPAGYPYGHRGGLISPAEGYSQGPGCSGLGSLICDQEFGCVYDSMDAPGVGRPLSQNLKRIVGNFLQITIDLHFVGRIIDVCNGNVVEERLWSVECDATCLLVNGKVKCNPA